MAKLVIVESPAKAKTIGKFLGSGYKVEASMGHVRDLPKRSLAIDVANDFSPTYETIKGKEKLVEKLRADAASAQDVYLATDPDREGEAISWHLCAELGLDPAKVKRVKFNEINRRSVENGIADPGRIDIDLVNAQQARRILDRIVGYKLSPFISSRIHKGLSAGRVQSVAVKMIVDREREIRAFVPEEYWTLDARLSAPPSRRLFKASFVGDESGKVKITNAEQCERYKARLDNAVWKAVSVRHGTRRRNPLPPYITSTLQQDASHRLGFFSRRTMKIAQELYEGVNVEGRGQTGLITYMRTDSLRISEESRAAGNAVIEAMYGKKYIPEKQRYFKVGKNAQDGHEAIRPVDPSLTPEMAKSSLTPEQYRLYDLIWKRFIASLMASCVQNTMNIDITAARPEDEAQGRYCSYSASGYSIKFDGYLVLYDDRTDEEKDATVLPDISEGDILRLKELTGEQHFTKPPARYTEATLIKALEETGVGRPSTYATIISTVIDREYVAREGRTTLKPTELGEASTVLLEDNFPNIVNTKFTAGMESELDEVEEGKVDYVNMLRSFYDGFASSLQDAKEKTKGVKITLESEKTDIPCPKCGKKLIIKVGRFGKFYGCPGYPECDYTTPYYEKTPGKCPDCGEGEILLRLSRKGHPFYGCSRYPDCRFSTWDVPTAETCPNCGSTLFKKSRGGTLVCHKEGCGYEGKAAKKKD
ncbi:MAG: type I DNA topoisomerase [Clostridiales bacterium]|nr:type I DNA topoisomerase [Clostridiales bacterium]